MRLCTIRTKEIAPTFGIELKSKVLRVPEAAVAFALSAADQALVASTATWVADVPRAEKVLRQLLKAISEEPKRLARPAADGHPILLPCKDVEYLPPIARPAKILCVGMNYRDHCEEQNKPIPKAPMIFAKFATCLVGHGAPIVLPTKLDKCIDYEAELAIVIGKRATRVTKRTARKHIAGYTIVNDVSARTVQANERQWTRAKGFDGSCPIGPVIVTADEIPDPHSLAIELRLNGKVRQKSNTANLVFNVDYIVSFVSQAITLEPGDIISTGTPGGVGVYSNPQVFLANGDIVTIRIDRIGTLENVCTEG